MSEIPKYYLVTRECSSPEIQSLCDLCPVENTKIVVRAAGDSKRIKQLAIRHGFCEDPCGLCGKYMTEESLGVKRNHLSRDTGMNEIDAYHEDHKWIETIFKKIFDNWGK